MMPLKLTGKTIADPLYGNITLTEIESLLVSSRAFQRLHGVRQLGLGHLVFPSAGYSRFSHSVGACFNADRILTAIEANSDRKFCDVERQAFRIAALFHDLGHYPFSHTTEHAAKRYYLKGMYSSNDDSQGTFEIIGPHDEAPSFLDHEDAGDLIFQEDNEIDAIFAKSSISKDDVRSVYLNESLLTLISSDLDCDRLDYLKRTALHSGAPYGAVDVDFIISKSTVDSLGRFCFDRKALRAADHLLMSRFYDFMQIPFHKTVAALEWSLEESVIHLLKRGSIGLSKRDVTRMLRGGEWVDFDDGAMTQMMREALESGDADDVALDHLEAVLRRRAAKSVYNWDCLVSPDSLEQEQLGAALEAEIEVCCERYGMDRRRFHIWNAPFKLTKAGPILQSSPGQNDEPSDEERQQLIHILEKGADISQPLIDFRKSVSHHLSKVRYKVLRVYYLLPKGDGPSIKTELRAHFNRATQ